MNCAQFVRHGFDVLAVAENEAIAHAARRLSAIGARVEDLRTYNASKVFLKSFAEAIRNELKDSGVTVKPDPSLAEVHRRQSEPGSGDK